MRRYFDTFPILYIADLDKALEFYRDLLGFEVSYRYPAQGEPEFVALNGISLAATAEGQMGAHGWPITPQSGGFELCVYTDDVDAAVEELRSHGVLVLTEPADQPWEERTAYVADPDGHPVMICQRL
jgi:lactoylglutathione lyase